MQGAHKYPSYLFSAGMPGFQQGPGSAQPLASSAGPESGPRGPGPGIPNGSWVPPSGQLANMNLSNGPHFTGVSHHLPASQQACLWPKYYDQPIPALAACIAHHSVFYCCAETCDNWLPLESDAIARIPIGLPVTEV